VKATPTEDNSTYQYHIQLDLDGTTWQVVKRFSEFDVLLQSLSGTRYAGLPALPAKTLLGSPTDDAVIASRKEQLRIILNDLLNRPDTRTSQQVRKFLALDSHCFEAVRSVQPEALRTFEDPRFGVSDLVVSPESRMVVATHEDSTHLSRLGRVWSVVEADELGALHVWAQAPDESWKRTFSYTFGIKARSLAWEEASRQLFVGLEDGKIEVYLVPSETMQPVKKASLELHHKSPVTYLSASSRRLLSLGFDTAMRVIDVRSRELLCGGRLVKRLRNEADYLSCGLLDDAQDRAFVGSSGGDVFIFDISRNPPNFLFNLDFGSQGVSMMCPCQDKLFVASGECIFTVSLEEKGKEQRISKLGTHRCKYLAGGEATALSVATAPARGLVFGGFSDGSVAIWTAAEIEACIVFRAHDSDVTKLAWIELPTLGPTLYTGGGDGKITSWRLSGSVEDYTFWAPQQAAAMDAASIFNAPIAQVLGSPTYTGDVKASGPAAAAADGLDAFEPTFGTGPALASRGGGFPDAVQRDNPRINPKALKGADDSDSGDDLAGAFG